MKNQSRRPRTRVAKTNAEIVSSTTLALRKNPSMNDNIQEHTPDPKATRERRVERANKVKQQKADEKWEKLCADVSNM